MYYLNYSQADVNNGTGLRNVLWLSQCSHGCKGCFNKSSWKKGGTKVTEEFILQILEDLDKPFISGITFSGGDPLHKNNYQGVINLCRRIKKELPEKNIWLWTGYTYEELQNDLLRQPILTTVDTLVEGKFVQELSKNPPPFRGSSNQRILHLSSTGTILGEM